MHIQLNGQTTISAPAQKVWRVLAQEFASIGQWVSAIPHSEAVTDVPAPDGAEVADGCARPPYRASMQSGNNSPITMNRPCTSPTRQPTATPSLSSAPRTTWLYVHSGQRHP